MIGVNSPERDANVSGITNWWDLYEFFNKEAPKLPIQADKEELLDAIRTFCCGCIKDALRKPQDESMEALVSLWDIFMNVAPFFEWTQPFNDKLICLLLWTKEFEVLRRTIYPEEMNTRSSWECHRLLEVVQKSWSILTFAGHESLAKQCNLANFTTMAFSIGNNDWLGITALWYLHQALEISDIMTVRLAPVTIIWIRTAGAKLLTLSILRKKWNNQDINRDALDVELIQIPGTLARLGGVNHPGFSLERWFFWKSRFEHLALDEDEDNRWWARDTVDYMTQFDSMLEMQKEYVDNTDMIGSTEEKVESDGCSDSQMKLTMEMTIALENKRLRLLVGQKD